MSLDLSKKGQAASAVSWPSVADFSERRVYRALLLVGVLLVALVTALVYIGKESLWGDEMFSVYVARTDWNVFWRHISTREGNMALYYILLRFWIGFGVAESTIRGLSALFAVATIPVVYLLGARLFGFSIGIVAALLLALNAFFVYYAQEARGYSLALLLVTASSYFFVLGVQRPSPKIWIAYVLTSALGVYTHFFVALVLLGHAFSLLFLNRKVLPWRSLAISYLSIVVLLVPIGIFALALGAKYGDVVAPLGWVDRVTFGHLYQLALALTGQGGPTILALFFALCSLALIAGIKVWFQEKTSFSTWRYALLLSWLFVPILVTFSFTLAIRPIYVTRFLIVSLPPVMLLAAIGLSQIRYRSLFGVALGTLLVLSSVALISSYLRLDKEDWRGLTRYVVTKAETDDGLIFQGPRGRSLFEYNLDRINARDKTPQFIYPATDRLLQDILGRQPDSSLFETLPDRYSGLWLILSPVHSREGTAIKESLPRTYILDDVQRFNGIEVSRYRLGSVTRK